MPFDFSLQNRTLQNLLASYQEKRKENYLTAAFPANSRWKQRHGQSYFAPTNNIDEAISKFSFWAGWWFTTAIAPFSLPATALFSHTNQARIQPINRLLELTNRYHDTNPDDHTRENILKELTSIKETIIRFPSQSAEYKQLLEVTESIIARVEGPLVKDMLKESLPDVLAEVVISYR